jgi:hypothetical protein
MNQNDFDNLLKRELRGCRINVPDGFTEKLLGRIQQEEYEAALARIKKMERILIAEMITVPVLMIILFLLAGTQITAGVNNLIADARSLVTAHTQNMVLTLKYLAVIATLTSVLVYILFDKLLPEN